VPSVLLPPPLSPREAGHDQLSHRGTGPPLLFIHGGWGYQVYPIDIGAFSSDHTVVIPDRSGYGGSTDLDDFRRTSTIAPSSRLGVPRFSRHRACDVVGSQ